MQYYDDAIRVSDPGDFLRHYDQLQPGLLEHSRTHAPGSVLVMYALIWLLGALFSRNIIRKFVPRSVTTGYFVFVVMTIPSVQTYSLASEDAIIASCVLGALSFFLALRTSCAMGGCAIFLFLAAFLTFGFLFAIPVIVLYDLAVNRSMVRSLASSIGAAACYVVLYWLTDFNYVNSFLTASAVHLGSYHVGGDPASYFLSRVQDVLEILMFLGPALTLLAVAGALNRKRCAGGLRLLGGLGCSHLIGRAAQWRVWGRGNCPRLSFCLSILAPARLSQFRVGLRRGDGLRSLG